MDGKGGIEEVADYQLTIGCQIKLLKQIYQPYMYTTLDVYWFFLFAQPGYNDTETKKKSAAHGLNMIKWYTKKPSFECPTVENCKSNKFFDLCELVMGVLVLYVS